MARAVTIGNGTILVGIDFHGQVRDLYYPHVGHANHVSGASGNYTHRIGVYVDGSFAWLNDPSWNISVSSDADTAVGKMVAEHQKLGVRLTSTDAVHNERNVFIREVLVENISTHAREIKVFFAQQFRIDESRRGDTGYYDPRVKAIVHYKGNVSLLVNAYVDGLPFSDYNIGLFGIEGKEGTYLDAVDGILERNPIEHGSVDSVLGLTCELNPGEQKKLHYWIVCGASIPEVHTLDEYVLEETPERLVASTKSYWHAWVNKEEFDLSLVSPDLQKLYNQSLITIRVHTDNGGGIIASSDTDMLHHGRDTYAYVWPRDGALIVRALDDAGYVDAAQRFFEFMATCQEPGGYLMHKYRTDGVLGSSWHPWFFEGQPRLPIQEDETALVLISLWKHYERNKDLEFIESLYNRFIEPAAQFMMEYIEPTTGLPQASFDLWEEKYGTSTYTTAAVVHALMCTSRFALMLGKENDARTYQAVAQRMQSAALEHLYDPELRMFVKHVIHRDDGVLEYDRTVDISSFYGVVQFGLCELDDERVLASYETVKDRLSVRASSTGFMRYEGDSYYTMNEAGTPNPWVIATLWVARYQIMSAATLTDLETPYELLDWTCSHSAGAGVLAEQMHPHTREHLSTAPLVWSHAEYVMAVRAYVKKYHELAGADQ